MKPQTTGTAQLAFDSWLEQADEDNGTYLFLKSVAHLPGTWDDALPYYKNLLDLHHAAMLDADEDEAFRLKNEAHDLAAKLNGGTSFGILAPEGHGTRLEAATAAADGQFPLWGQAGTFTVDHKGTTVRIELDGLFGIGGSSALCPGFKAHAVDRRKPFISDTGFRSFMGWGYRALVPGQTPEQFIQRVLEDFIEDQLHGKLVRVKRQPA